MRYLIFANGAVNDGFMLRRALGSAALSKVVCADGGAMHASRFGIPPDLIIGDLDSLTAEQVAAFERAGVEIIRYAEEKDETDLELALRHCVEAAASSITIIGAFGGRIDQTLANIWLLSLPMLDGVSVEMVDGEQALRCLRPGCQAIHGGAGDTISLIPLSAQVDGITTTGLQYALADEKLTFGPARGISNVMLGKRASLSFRFGLLLLVHTHGRA